MQQQEFPLAYFLMDIGSRYAGMAPPSSQLQQFLDQFDALEWYTYGFQLTEIQEGWLISVNLPPLPNGELELTLPGFDLFSLVLQGEHFNEHPVLEILDPFSEGAYLELRNLRIALRLKQSLLRPVDGTLHAELAYTGSLKMDKQWQFSLADDPSLSLNRCEIGNSGILIGFSGVHFDFHTNKSITPLRALGFADEFRGIYAADAYLEVLPQSLFGETPGLRLEFRDLVLGSNGVSGAVRQYYELEIDNGQIHPDSGMVGLLFDDQLQLALEATEITLLENRVTRFRISGWLRLPVLEAIIAAEFGLIALPGGSYGYRLGLTQKTERLFQLGQLSLNISALALEGALEQDRFALSGQLSAALVIPGFDLLLQQAELELRHAPDDDYLRIRVENLSFGPLGDVDVAHFEIRSQLNSANDQREFSIHVQTQLQWQDIHHRLALDDLPDVIPLPPDDAEITAILTWENGKLVLRFAFEGTDLDALWHFIPPPYRPEVRRAALTFNAEYNDAAEFNNSSQTGQFNGALSVALSMRLPELPEGPFSELIAIDTGDETGWIDASMQTGVRTDDSGSQTPYVEMSIDHPLSVDWNIPGMVQSPAPIHTALTALSFDIDTSDSLEGSLALNGAFHLRPIAPPDYLPFAPHLQQLMVPMQDAALAGTVAFELAFKDDKAALMLDCQFSDADFDFDIFDVINNLARGLGDSDSDNEAIPLDLDIGFDFKGIRIELGSLDANNDQHFLFQFGLALTLPGIDPVESHFRLSNKEFALGISRAAIPLEIPAFPLSAQDFDQFTPATPADAPWSPTSWNDYLTTLQNQINTLNAASDPTQHNRELRELGGKLFLLQNLKNIYGLMSTPANERLFQTYSETLVEAFNAISAVTHLESNIELVLENVQLTIPFEDPQALGLTGTAYLDGFADDDPFKAIEGLQMSLGLSADQFYFELENPGDPIPLPDFGRYPGGSINLSRLRIGYAYTRNALSVAFAGALVLPEQLIEDADSSDVIGAGIRLPSHNALSFRLDLIPVTLGAVDFVVPLFEFDLDLRRPNSPSLLSTKRCQPYWDGLQMIVPGLYHDSLKHLAFSPLFSMCVIPNFRFDGDLMLGDDNNGLTVVADDVLVLLGYMTSVPVPIPFFASPTEPYFENLCVNLRFAGFGINFNLQRPFPSLSPLALFEVLGLLADPMMPIDANGSLANTIKVALTDGSLTLPPQVRQLFPELAERIQKPLDITINLGTFISSTQHLSKTLDEVAKGLQQTGVQLQTRIDTLLANPPALELPRLLEMLPPELRKLRVSGAFAGFEATAVLVIINANDKGALKDAMQQRGGAPSLSTSPGLQLGVATDGDQVRHYRPNIPTGSGFSRELRTDDPNNNLLLGIEFESFDDTDIDALPAPRRSMNGVLVGTHVKVFAGQRYRFLGCVYEDGSFGLISALDVTPLELTVAGMAIALPLSVHGRLQLQGRAKRDGVIGNLTAQVYGEWRPIPGIVKLTAGSKTAPLQLQLYSDGRFRIRGSGGLTLFRGGASLAGSVDISHTHCMMQGEFRYQIGNIIDLSLDCAGRIGPGDGFELAGNGQLNILGQPLSKVSGRITESGAAIKARLDLRSWPVNGHTLDCRLRCYLSGEINLRRRARPEFQFEGDGVFSVLGASIEGRGGIRQTRRDTSVYMQGALRWQGQRWLEGRVAIGNKGVSLGGHLGFGLALSPSNIASTDLAHLFLSIELDGDFTLDAAAAMAKYKLSGKWTLGARLPGSDQVLPLAAQSFRHQGSTDLALTFVAVSGFTMLPFDGITIPVPTLTAQSQPSPVRFGEITHNVIGGGQIKNPAASWHGYKLELIGGAVPVVSSGTLSNSQTKRKIATGYDIGFDSENGIDINLPFDAAFELALVWRASQQKLAIRTRRSGIPDQFKNLDATN